MKVLLTGIPGWLGNRFLEILVKGFHNEGPITDWEIRCFVLEGNDIRFIESLSMHKKIEIVFGDVRNKRTLTRALRDIDIIFHMAGIIHPKKIKDLYLINTLGTLNLISEAAACGVKRFIYISSNSVGGINLKHYLLMKEEDRVRPYMNYGLSKYYAEAILRSFQQEGRIDTVILRPCWFYGPHQSERQTRFFKMIQKGDPVIFGNGLNFRSLSYVDNTSLAMLLSAESKKASGQTYWIADERPYTTYEIYQTVAELLEVRKFNPVFLPGFSSELFLICDKIIQKMGLYITEIHVAGEMNKDIACDIQKAKTELGYAPKIELKEGMRSSIEWCRQRNYLK